MCITNVRIVKSITSVCLLFVSKSFQVCCGRYNKKTARSAVFVFGQCHGQDSSAHRIYGLPKTVVVIVNVHSSARAYIGMPVCNDNILACIGLFVVIIKARCQVA